MTRLLVVGQSVTGRGTADTAKLPRHTQTQHYTPLPNQHASTTVMRPDACMQACMPANTQAGKHTVGDVDN